MDERQELQAGRAAIIVLALIALGALGWLTWDYIRTKQVTNTAALGVLLAASGLYFILDHLLSVDGPRTMFNIQLPISSSPRDRQTRLSFYALDAALVSVGLTVLAVGGMLLGDKNSDTLSLFPGITSPFLAGLIGFAVMVVVFFVVNYLIGEAMARRAERHLERLES